MHNPFWITWSTQHTHLASTAPEDCVEKKNNKIKHFVLSFLLLFFSIFSFSLHPTGDINSKRKTLSARSVRKPLPRLMANLGWTSPVMRPQGRVIIGFERQLFGRSVSREGDQFALGYLSFEEDGDHHKPCSWSISIHIHWDH